MTTIERYSLLTSQPYIRFEQRINPSEDLRNIGQVPCARQALLTGIAGGTGFGAVVFLSRRSA
jgi:hypothetical protein